MTRQQPHPHALTALQQSVLEFERRWQGSAEVKEDAVREQLGLTPVRYQQVLQGLLDDPRALQADPVLVHRLLRLRDAVRSRGGR